MRERPRLEFAGAALALLAGAAFLASFAFGLGGGGADAATRGELLDAPPAAGRIEVLNASGRSGMARAATARLRGAGFDVVFYGNAPASAGDSSVVIDRIGQDVLARAAAAELGIRRITSRPDSSLYLDATVIVGVDWVPDTDAQSGAAQGWRARLRRWFGRGS